MTIPFGGFLLQPFGSIVHSSTTSASTDEVKTACLCPCDSIFRLQVPLLMG